MLLPGGILIFTVNDERTLLPGRELDGSGAWFEPASENERLDPRRYGSTWVDESFVARALARATRSAPEYRRLPRGLWASQDVYVVAAPGGGDPLPDPLPIALEPAGVLEDATVEQSGAITLRGWAIMPDGAPVARVEAAIDGITAGATVPDRARADVAARFAASPERAALALPAWSSVSRRPLDAAVRRLPARRRAHADRDQPRRSRLHAAARVDRRHSGLSAQRSAPPSHRRARARGATSRSRARAPQGDPGRVVVGSAEPPLRAQGAQEHPRAQPLLEAAQRLVGA